MTFKSPDFYSSTDTSLFQGRFDGTAPEDLRWHQHIQTIDLNKYGIPALNKVMGFALIGFRCEEGVARNLGRLGAADGPVAIRQAMSSLPVHFSPEKVCLVDLGDIHCIDNQLETAQQALGGLVGAALQAGYFPIVLGGGHEVAYGSWMGTTALRQSRRLGVLNLDAHLDLRPISEKTGRTSGNSFTAMDADEQEYSRRLLYLCMGVQRMGNTQSLFNKAADMQATLIEANRLTGNQIEGVHSEIDQFATHADDLYLTICMDAFSPAFAPGVSAPTVLGLAPNPELISCLHKMVETRKLVLMDVAEVNPRYDIDGRTSRLAAALIFTVVTALTEQKLTR